MHETSEEKDTSEDSGVNNNTEDFQDFLGFHIESMLKYISVVEPELFKGSCWRSVFFENLLNVRRVCLFQFL